MVSGAKVPRTGFNIYYRRHDRASAPASSSSSIRFPERRRIAVSAVGKISTHDIHRTNVIDEANNKKRKKVGGETLRLKNSDLPGGVNMWG